MQKMFWGKFHSLFGNYLKIGFETTFPKFTIFPKDMLYDTWGLVYQPTNEPIMRIYEPATKIIGSCLDGDASQVVFEPVSQKKSLYRRLVFARKIGHKTQKPCCWVVAARHGEIATFGFDSWNSKDPRYLALAYPGKNPDGQFTPVYFKIQRSGKEEGKEGEKNFIYLEVWALDDEVQFFVRARRINEQNAPEHLCSAKPERSEK